MDLRAVQAAVARQAARVTPDLDDIERYIAAHVYDASHRELIGPVKPPAGASGLVVHEGHLVASWGRTDSVEMGFSLAKALLATVAGIAHERDLLHDVRTPVCKSVEHPAFETERGRIITWEHLLQQTSGWTGELWGKPDSCDRQSAGVGSYQVTEPPGTVWTYNDVRANLLALALTLLWRRDLEDVLRTEFMRPVGATDSWSWHGYANSVVSIDGRDVKVVAASAHWGGGIWISADDLARVGRLYLSRGERHGQPLLAPDWIDASWTPAAANPDYGYLWWLNDRGKVFPSAPRTGRAARGNSGRHLLWIDPGRDLVIVSRWGEGVDALLWEVSRAIRAPRILA